MIDSNLQNSTASEVVAAYAFVETMVKEADIIVHGQFPAWHGWALREAFAAGAKWQRDNPIPA